MYRGVKRNIYQKEDKTIMFLRLILIFAVLLFIVTNTLKHIDTNAENYECTVNSQLYNCVNCYSKDGIGYCYIDYELVKVDSFYEVDR